MVQSHCRRTPARARRRWASCSSHIPFSSELLSPLKHIHPFTSCPTSLLYFLLLDTAYPLVALASPRMLSDSDEMDSRRAAIIPVLPNISLHLFFSSCVAVWLSAGDMLAVLSVWAMTFKCVCCDGASYSARPIGPWRAGCRHGSRPSKFARKSLIPKFWRFGSPAFRRSPVLVPVLVSGWLSHCRVGRCLAHLSLPLDS